MTSGQKCDKMEEPGHQISWSGGDKPRGATDKLPRAFKPPALALFYTYETFIAGIKIHKAPHADGGCCV